jgi:hypothetical protein
MHVLSCVTSPTAADAVINAFLNHVDAKGAEIISLRATVFYLLDDNTPIPMLEWTEKGMEGMALFKFDEVSGLCSYLIHYGIGSKVLKSPGCWEKCRLTWSFVDIHHLKIVLGAAQSMKVVMGWSIEDILNLYCKRQAAKASKETFICPLFRCIDGRLARYAKLLYEHFRYQKEQGMLFENIASLVAGRSAERFVRGRDGKGYPLFEASWM